MTGAPRHDYVLVAGPGRSGSTFLYRLLGGHASFRTAGIKEAYLYRSPRRLRRALRDAAVPARILVDAANLAWRDPGLVGGLARAADNGCRTLVVGLLREHRARARSMIRFRRSRGEWSALFGRTVLERAVLRDSLRPDDLSRLIGLGAVPGVDVLVVDFGALTEDTEAVLGHLAAVSGVPGFDAPPRGPVNVSVRARSVVLSAAGKLAAAGLRRAGLGRLLQRLKDSPRTERLFFRPGADAGTALGPAAEARLAARHAACLGVLGEACERAGPGIWSPRVRRNWRPAVSIVVPARNEPASLPGALASALAQDYDGPMEIIVADGSDGPATAEAVRARFADVRVIPNPGRSAAAGLNRAIAAAAHPVIVRLDAHAVLPSGYVRRAVATLGRTGAANVGGRQAPVGTTAFERAVALAMTMPLGAGGARYRLGGPEGPVDTVYLGVFRRTALEAAGGFDTSLGRNQDYELNRRLRVMGATVWFDPALAVEYRPRGSLASLARQYFDYGRWKRVVLVRDPGALRPRQLAPPALVLGLAGAAVAAVVSGTPGAAAVLPLAWLALLVAGSAVAGLRRREPAAWLAPAALAVMHLAWGIGFLAAPAR